MCKIYFLRNIHRKLILSPNLSTDACRTKRIRTSSITHNLPTSARSAYSSIKAVFVLHVRCRRDSILPAMPVLPYSPLLWVAERTDHQRRNHKVQYSTSLMRR